MVLFWPLIRKLSVLVEIPASIATLSCVRPRETIIRRTRSFKRRLKGWGQSLGLSLFRVLMLAAECLQVVEQPKLDA